MADTIIIPALDKETRVQRVLVTFLMLRSHYVTNPELFPSHPTASTLPVFAQISHLSSLSYDSDLSLFPQILDTAL